MPLFAAANDTQSDYQLNAKYIEKFYLNFVNHNPISRENREKTGWFPTSEIWTADLAHTNPMTWYA